MVAVIKTSHSINSILNYNENKVKAGVAECIGAVNYPVEVAELNFTAKLNRFLNLAQLNENAKRTSVHISLNFDPSENHSKEKLIEIADTYMEKIGFGKQPYLVYQHNDAGHPHLHVVTNNIQKDGKRIDLHLLGIRKSEPARKEIEELFGLIKAEGRNKTQNKSMQEISSTRIDYGKVESKKAINSVLNKVLTQYKYSSLPELNAVLKDYNVMADRGHKDSKIFLTNGLLYRILDKEGNPIGIPIKASDFHLKPTMKFLEKKFKDNEIRQPYDKLRIKRIIDHAFLRNKNLSLNELTKRLEREGIRTVLRRSEAGLLYGITYVDHKTHNVFNGSSLGKEYSAKAIQDRCGEKISHAEKNLNQGENLENFELFFSQMDQILDEQTSGLAKVTEKIINTLLGPVYVNHYIPYELTMKGHLRKRRRL